MKLKRLAVITASLVMACAITFACSPFGKDGDDSPPGGGGGDDDGSTGSDTRVTPPGADAGPGKQDSGSDDEASCLASPSMASPKPAGSGSAVTDFDVVGENVYWTTVDGIVAGEAVVGGAGAISYQSGLTGLQGIAVSQSFVTVIANDKILRSYERVNAMNEHLTGPAAYAPLASLPNDGVAFAYGADGGSSTEIARCTNVREPCPLLKIVPSLVPPTAMAASGNTLVVAFGPMIRAINVVTSSAIPLGSTAPTALGTDLDNAYYTDMDKKLFSVPLVGGLTTMLGQLKGKPNSIAVGARYVFVGTDSGLEVLSKVPGCQPITIAPGPVERVRWTLLPARVYWLNAGLIRWLPDL